MSDLTEQQEEICNLKDKIKKLEDEVVRLTNTIKNNTEVKALREDNQRLRELSLNAERVGYETGYHNFLSDIVSDFQDSLKAKNTTREKRQLQEQERINQIKEKYNYEQ